MIKKLVLLCLLAQAPNQQMYTIYPRPCLTEIKIDEDARLEIPWVDGQPDKLHAKLVGVHITYDPACTKATNVIRRGGGKP